MRSMGVDEWGRCAQIRRQKFPRVTLAMAIFQSQNASTDTSALPDETYGSGRKCVGSGECPIAWLEEKRQQNGAAAMMRSFLWDAKFGAVGESARAIEVLMAQRHFLMLPRRRCNVETTIRNGEGGQLWIINGWFCGDGSITNLVKRGAMKCPEAWWQLAQSWYPK